jgi:hypothetical protein
MRDILSVLVNRIVNLLALSLLLGSIACIAEPTAVAPSPNTSTDGGTRMLPPVRPFAFPVDVRGMFDVLPDAVFTLADGALLTQTGTTVLYFSGLGNPVQTLEFSFEEIVAAEALPWGAVLIWSTDGFYVWENDQVQRSPISDIIPITNRGNLLVAPGPEGKKDLWIASPDALRLWRDEQAFTIRPGSFSTRSVKLAFGAPWQGQPALWLASGLSIQALVSTATMTQAHESLSGFSASELVVDFEGTVWVLSEGRLLSRSWENEWVHHTGLGQITGIAGHRDSTQLWIRTAEDGLWSHRAGIFQPVEWEDNTIRFEDIGTSTGTFDGFPQGQALVQSEDKLYVVTPGRYVEIIGLIEGQLLTSTVTIDVQVSQPDTVDTIEAFLDDVALVSTDAPTRFEIYPGPLSDGTHRIAVKVTYVDGAPTSHVQRRVSVYTEVPPHWSSDILPLFQDSCEVCHGLRGTARLLNTPQLWRSSIDRILNTVRRGMMPLPPSPRLSDVQIEKIEGWRAVGFLE